jgi:periplasmic protein CpxP/Spy
MNLSQEQREQIAGELKKLGAELNLSPEQKEKAQNFLTETYNKVQEFKSQHPSVSKEDLIKKVAAHRAQLRERLVSFLTPEQLKKWDTGVGRAKEFLGQKLAA